jgi:phage shock protein E
MTTDKSKSLLAARMMLIFGAFLLIGLLYIAVVALRGPVAEKDQVSGVDAGMLLAFQADPATLTLIDARSSAEYAAAHIAGAVNVPFDAVEANESLLPVDKDEPVVIHCKTGRRAGLLKEQLIERGYTDVRVLPSEQIEWGEDGPVGLLPVPASDTK